MNAQQQQKERLCDIVLPFKTATASLALTEKRQRESATNRERDPCLKSRTLYKEVGNWYLIFYKLFFFSAQVKKKSL